MDSISWPGSSRRPNRTASRTILLVDDDDGVRRGLQLLFSARGHTVRAYSSALRLARDPAALGCDCLVADLIMPPTDAITLLGSLRHVGWNGHAILISGFLDDGWQAKAHAAGFEAVLGKPISARELVRIIEELPA
jgi:FixJ family two-component response regulator